MATAYKHKKASFFKGFLTIISLLAILVGCVIYKKSTYPTETETTRQTGRSSGNVQASDNRRQSEGNAGHGQASEVDVGNSYDDDYSGFTPQETSLLSLTPYTGNPFTEAEYPMEDVFSTTFDYCIYSNLERSNGTHYASYRVNGQYSTFVFWSGIVSYGRGDPGTASIKVYGDNDVIYERDLACDSSTQYVELDISDYADLTLELYGYSESELSLRGSTALWPAIFEPTLLL